ncbi:MAG: hypothetical protein ABIH34_08460 [Nanoarchaeota archaeon]
MKTLYVFGNEHLDQDNMAHHVAKHLEGVSIMHCFSPEALFDAKGDELLLLDVVKDIDKPMIITDPTVLKTKNLMSLHDFDLGYFLQMMEALGEGKKVKIIGVPPTGDRVEWAKQVSEWL